MKSTKHWVLENKLMSVEIGTSTGEIVSLALKKKKFEMMEQGGFGRLEVYDEKKECLFPSGVRPLQKIKGRLSTKKEEKQLCVKKEFKGANFFIEEKFTLSKDRLHWSARIIKQKGKDRSLKVCFQVPFPLDHKRITAPLIEKRRWEVWAAITGAPFSSDMNYLRFSYGDESNRADVATIPALVFYNRSADIGISLIKPFEDYTPRMEFDLDRRKGYARITNEYLALRNSNSPYVSLNIVPHAGCFRASLAWMYKTYKQYFVPPSLKIYGQEGVMYYGLEAEEKYIAAWKKAFNLKWQEVQQTTASVGGYVSDKESWDFDCWKKFKRFKPVRNITHKKVDKYLEILRKYDVAGFMYFDVGDYVSGGEGKVPEKFAESVIHNDKNEKISLTARWAPSLLYHMDPDPDFQYGREMIRQLKMVKKKFPQMTGIFFDQALYQDFNFSRDDGMTMINNIPCFNTEISYIKFLKRMREILDKDKLTVFANNPAQIERSRYFDGVMAESDRDFLAYLCLSKPLVTIGGRNEKALQWCLKWGAFPHIPPILYEGSHLSEYVSHTPKKEDISLYKRYYQIIKYFYARSWVLEPHALELPEELDGNIFQTREGDYLVTLIPKEKEITKKKISLSIKLKKANSIRKAYLITVDKVGEQEIEFVKMKDKSILIELDSPLKFSAAAIKLGN